MKITNQRQIWDAIAPEWYKFKDKSGEGNINFIKKQKGRILDLGCGGGRNFTKTKAEIYALDFSSEMIKYANKKAKRIGLRKIKFFIADADSLPFKDNFFDSAMCIALLHCIKGKIKRKRVLKELCRVLKPKALAKISVWNKNSTRFKNKKKEDFVAWRDKGSRYYYFYDENEIKKEAENIGFKIKEISSGRDFPNITLIIEK